MKKYIHPSAALQIVLCLWLLPMISHGENVMELVSATAGPDQNVTIQVKITNDDDFVAFQFEMLLPDEYTYVASSAQLNPSRVMDHVLQDTLFPDRKLRIFGYSITNTPFSGDTGTIVTFQFHTCYDPGSYILSFQNPVIGNAGSTNILTGTIEGILTIQCPDISFSADAIDFDAIPLTDSIDRILTINNTGNQDLSIQNITFDSPYFFVAGSTSFTIQGGQSSDVTVRFLSVIKGNYTQQMTITSNDPDEPLSAITLTAYAFPVNEIHTGNVFGYSGKQVTLNFSINNMEPFVGFQFDLCLPSPLTYISNSAVLSPRKANHTVSANMVSDQVLRVVAYPQDNQTFSGDDGDVLSLGFDVYGLGGYYGLNLENVLIGDFYGHNCISAFYNGTLEIAAPDIHSSGNLILDDVSILDTTCSGLTLYNSGTDTLHVTGIQFSDNHYYTDIICPLEVLVNGHVDVPVYFYSPVQGDFTGIMKIFSNDPDEYPYLVILESYAFDPNYLRVEDASSNFTGTIVVRVEAENYDDFVGFQFDLEFPGILTFLPASCALTTRAQGHVVQHVLLDSAHVRIFAYSLLQNEFLGHSGNIVTLGFLVDTDSAGTYPLTIQNAIMANAQSVNILHGVHQGTLYVQDPVNIQVISLPAGWNGISSYIIPSDPLVENIFAPVENDLIILMTGNQIYWPAFDINTILNWDTHRGYAIKILNPLQVVFSGVVETDRIIDLIKGWSVIPALSPNAIPSGQVFDPLEDTLVIAKEKTGSRIYWPAFGIFSLQYLQPGASYDILVTDNCQLTYPDNGRGLPRSFPVVSVESPWNEVCPTGGSHVIAFPADLLKTLHQGDILGAFTVEGWCSGISCLNNCSAAVALVVFEDDFTTPEIKEGFSLNETMHFVLFRPSSMEEFAVYVTYDHSFPQSEGVFVRNGLSKVSTMTLSPDRIPLLVDEDVLLLYPNPVNKKLTVTLLDQENYDFFLELWTLEGQLVRQARFLKESVDVSLDNLEPGVFLIRVYNEKKRFTARFVKL